MALFVLPFDHRATFARELTPDPRKISALKKIIYDGFLEARHQVDHPEELAILIDEQFGASIIRDAKRRKIAVAVSTEKSGQAVFTFEHGAKFRDALRNIKPNFAKALVRYDLAAKKENAIQRKRLKQLSDFCKKEKMELMIELLLTGPGSKAKQIEEAIWEMIIDGIEPTIWKLEGLDSATAWNRLCKLSDARIIVLGRGENAAHVKKWLIAGAKSPCVDGFAIGRTVFFKPIKDYAGGKIDRKTAVARISKNYLSFIRLWGKYGC